MSPRVRISIDRSNALLLGITALFLGACSSASEARRDLGGRDLAQADLTVAKADRGPCCDSAPPDQRADAVPGLPCDPVAQNCPAGATPRCTIDRTKGSRTTACVATGTVALGGDCEVTNKVDDCAAGGYCSMLTSPMGGAQVCRKICLRNEHCAKGEGCYAFSDNTSPAKFGICLPPCTPLGTDCPSGTSCKPFPTTEAANEFICIYPGDGLAPGSACVTSYNCADSAACVTVAGKLRCAPLCDATHACTTGNCQPMTGAFISAGTTSPSVCQ